MKYSERFKERECCDGPGGTKTYKHQVCMPINGRVVCIDKCIHQIVAALNAGGVPTLCSCCGHKSMPGRIDLEDGRVLVIVDDPDQIVWRGEEAEIEHHELVDLVAKRVRQDPRILEAIHATCVGAEIEKGFEKSHKSKCS